VILFSQTFIVSYIDDMQFEKEEGEKTLKILTNTFICGV
jgi:hypothetical protein